MWNRVSNYVNCVVLCLYFFGIKSFELSNVPIRSRAIEKQRCQLPEHPKNGLWTVYKATKAFYPNQFVPGGSVLQVYCRQNFKIDGDSTVVCIDGRWTAQLGQCLKTCASLYSTAIMKVTCKYNDRVLENCTEPLDGTFAYFQCADFYEDQSLELQPIYVCFNGKWSHSLPECVPICGRENVQSTTLIINGSEAKEGDYPWQVALYNVSNQELLCGGTLINQRVIVTAAHCITNDQGRMHSKEMYSVAVGKYYRQYNDLRDLDNAQFSNISEMFIPRQYRGEVQNYFGDIAILVTKEIFELSTRVQPICVDWGLNRQSTIDPRRITHGFVSGWGFTIEHKNPSNVLKKLQVPIISDEECIEKLPENYEKFLTDDKLCAGFLEKGTSVCKGDSGGGLVTPIQQGPTANRYYLVGVISLSPQAPTAEGGCDSQNYALYTRVHYYVQNFILKAEVKYRPIYTENNLELIGPTATVQPLAFRSSTQPIPWTTTTQPLASTATEESIIDPKRITYGFVSGWGITTEDEKPLNLLGKLQILINRNNKYMKKNYENYKKFLASDELYKKFLHKGTFVCKGDSGGGLIIQQGPTVNTIEGGNSDNYSRCSNISYYAQMFILEAEVRYEPIYSEDNLQVETSLLPTTIAGKPFPWVLLLLVTSSVTGNSVTLKSALEKNLIISDFHIRVIASHVSIPNEKNLTLECKKEYYMKGNVRNNTYYPLHYHTQWISSVLRCLESCNPLLSSTMKMVCFYNHSTLPNGVQRSIKKQKCLPFYDEVKKSRILTKNADYLKHYETCWDGF